MVHRPTGANANAMAATGPPAGHPPPAAPRPAASHHPVSVLPANPAREHAFPSDPKLGRTGIKITLDGIGAVIKPRVGTAPQTKTTTTPATVEQGLRAKDKNVKTLLADVRVPVTKNKTKFSISFFM